MFPIPYVRVVSYKEGRKCKGFQKKSKIGHIVIVVHFMYDLPVMKLRSRECRIYITNNPHIGYGKHLAFIPSNPRFGILENGSSTHVNHTETSCYDNKLNFLFFIGIPSTCDPLVTNNPHKGYGKHLAKGMVNTKGMVNHTEN